MLRVSSPLDLVNLTGAARSGFWAFMNPIDVFVFEWVMIPMNGGDSSAEIASLEWWSYSNRQRLWRGPLGERATYREV